MNAYKYNYYTVYIHITIYMDWMKPNEEEEGGGNETHWNFMIECNRNE